MVRLLKLYGTVDVTLVPRSNGRVVVLGPNKFYIWPSHPRFGTISYSFG